MKVKYVTEHDWGVSIKQTEIDKETEKSVWIDGRRNAKRSDWYNYFDTWGEARDFLMGKAEEKLRTARLMLQNAQGYMGNVKGLKEPVDKQEE